MVTMMMFLKLLLADRFIVYFKLYFDKFVFCSRFEGFWKLSLADIFIVYFNFAIGSASIITIKSWGEIF